MKFFVLGDRDTVLGFRLAGIEGQIIDTPQQGQEIMRKLLTDQNYGIIIVTESIGKMINIDDIRNRLTRYVF